MKTRLVVLLLLSMSFSAIAILPETASATTLYVGGAGPGNYTTIQDAINVSSPGDTVYVYSGTYYEDVRIKKSMSLIGQDMNTTVIDPGEDKDAIGISLKSWVNVTGFTLTNSSWFGGGVDVWRSQNCTISGNIFLGNHYAIRLTQSHGNVITGNSIIGISPESRDGIVLEDSNENIISNNEISVHSPGIRLYHSDNNAIGGNRLTETRTGILIRNSTSNSVMGNEAYSNEGEGIYFTDSPNSTIADNVVSENDDDGISVGSSSNTVISGNTVSGNPTGISVTSSVNVTMTGNVMVDNGIHLGGQNAEHWTTHSLDTSNTVNGKPVYYWRNVVGGTVPSGAGQVILANCSGVVVRDQNLSNATAGLQLGFSSGIMIRDNSLLGNALWAVRAYQSSNNTIVNNTVSRNGGGILADLGSSGNSILDNDLPMNEGWGIGTNYLASRNIIAGNTISTTEKWGKGIILYILSDNNTVENNTVTESWYGIHLVVSRSNRIANNTISMSNDTGIYLQNSTGSKIYHNNLINNSRQAYDNADANQWDSGHPLGGNYWSNYTGVDNCSGPNQDVCPDPDGIGDTPYNIDPDSQDNYPLMNPYSPPPPENQSPIVTIESPTTGAYVWDTWPITGTAADSDGDVERVEIRIDDGPWTNATGTDAWSFDWDTTTYAEGNHTIHVRSYDGTDYSDEMSVTVIVEQVIVNGWPLPFFVQAWFWAAVIVGLAMAVILYMLLRRRKKETEEGPPV